MPLPVAVIYHRFSGRNTDDLLRLALPLADSGVAAVLPESALHGERAPQDFDARLAGDRDNVSVVADQVGNPTSALDIADGILLVATNLVSDSSPELRGVFHMTASGEASWADFASAIFAASAARGGASASVTPIGTVDYPTPATRPANSRLDCGLIARTHGVTLPAWQGSLDTVIARLHAATN